jgi:hypothetical protein
MQRGKMEEAGNKWDKALLSFFFGNDQNLAKFSARDTLVPMLRDDRRTLPDAAMRQFLESIGLDQQAGDVASQVYSTYTTSTPIA